MVVDLVPTAAILEYDHALHQDIHLTILSPPLSRAKSSLCIRCHWRYRGCLVPCYSDHRYLSMLADTVLLAASWPGSLYPSERLLHYTCFPKLSYRYRRFDAADSMHLAPTDQKEQEVLALGDILAWFIVSSALRLF